jgi:hypothetical protein
MDPQCAAKRRELFEECLELDPQSRHDLLDARCSDDPELRAEIERLLAQVDRHDPFIDGDGYAAFRKRLFAENRVVGEHIGGYVLKQYLGGGGMGVVYLAEREGQKGKPTAVKLLRSELATDEFRERFERERDLLGALRGHPNIDGHDPEIPDDRNG